MRLFLVVIWIVSISCSRQVPECRKIYSAVRKDAVQMEQESYLLDPVRKVGEYFISLSIGGQTVDVVVDTGSANLIVNAPNDVCANCIDPRYDPSKTAIDNAQAISVGYASGRARAKQYTDDVGLTCRDDHYPAAFGVLTDNTDGIPNVLGLAGKAVAFPSADPLEPLFDQYFTAFKDRFDNIFTLTLCGEREGSTVILGDIDERVSRDSIQFVPLIGEKYYAIDARLVNAIGWTQGATGYESSPNSKVNLGEFETSQAGKGVLTIVDSGTTFSFFPPTIANNMLKLIKTVAAKNNIIFSDAFLNGKELREMTSAEMALFPKFELVVRGETDLVGYVLDPEVYFKTDTNSSKRAFSFHPRGGGRSKNILGQSVMENFYIEHDRDNKRLGIASNKALCGKSS